MAKLAQEIGKKNPFATLEEEVCLNCIRTADWLHRGGVMLFRTVGLSPTQYNVLRILRGVGKPGISCHDIAARMITREPDLTRLLDRLEKRGLATRHRQSDDRRVVICRITEAGLTLANSLDEPVRQLHQRQLHHMGEEKLMQLSDLLEEARQQPYA
jgi:DNA-binding MarR family transcriptional regulator